MAWSTYVLTDTTGVCIDRPICNSDHASLIRPEPLKNLSTAQQVAYGGTTCVIGRIHVSLGRNDVCGEDVR